MQKRAAFSLVELLVASAIFVVIMVTIYSGFHAGIFSYRNTQERLNLYQAAGIILRQINLDLMNSFPYSEKETKFSGNNTEISFLSLMDTFNKDKVIQEYSLVSYRLEGNRLMRLCRKNKEALNDESEILAEELSESIKRFSLSYGYLPVHNQPLEWIDSWTDPAKFPQAIKVELTLANNKIEQDFERTIFLLF